MRGTLAWLSGGRARARWRASLGEVIHRVQDAGETTERDFLRVGASLESILSRARREAEALAALAEAAGGDGWQALERALGEVAEWAARAGRVAECGRALGRLAPAAQSVEASLGELRNCVRVLRITSILLRIESVRLGSHGAGFEALAGEVEALASEIGGKAEAILCAVGEIRAVAGQAVRQADEMENRERAGLLRLTSESAQGIGALRAEHERLAAAAGDAHARYGTVVSGIGAVLTSLQSHDAARQRLEHVVEALAGLSQRLEGASGTGATAGVVELQSAQLREAGQSMEAGVGEIRASLSRVAEGARGLAGAARELAGGAGAEGGPSTDAVERHYQAVAAAIAEWSASRTTLADAAARVRRSCESIGDFVGEIESVGTRMLRLALNAEIQAVQLTVAGAAVMESVAESIRRLTGEASQHAETASLALREMEPVAMGAAASLSQASTENPGQAAAEAGRMATEVRVRNAEKGRVLSAVARGAEALAAEIRELADGITAHQTMAAIADACLKALDAVRAGAGTGRLRPAGEESLLHQARRSYTMQSEREVHDAMVAAVSPETAPPAVMAAQSEFGGNVELF
jgi:hypothetical protein